LSCGHGSAGFGERIIVDGGEGADHEAGQVAEDGSAARRNDASSQESVEAPDGIVDPVSVLEVTSVIQKLEGKVIGTVRLRFRVSMAKAWLEGLAPSCGICGRWQKGRGSDGGRVLRMRASFFVFKLREGYPPRVFLTKEFRKY
jgi:hypothetical protein